MSERCEKCGGKSVLVRWHGKGGGADCGWFAKIRVCGEHLHYTCQTCLYEWSGPAAASRTATGEREA